MSASLVDRIRRSRLLKVEFRGFTLNVRRPTDIEVAQLFRSGNEINKHDLCRDFVISWKGVKESDLIDGGTDDELPFDLDAWHAWCADDMTLWEPVYEAAMEAYVQHAASRDEKAKN